jgi:hypothetical protein
MLCGHLEQGGDCFHRLGMGNRVKYRKVFVHKSFRPTDRWIKAVPVAIAGGPTISYLN